MNSIIINGHILTSDYDKIFKGVRCFLFHCLKSIKYKMKLNKIQNEK